MLPELFRIGPITIHTYGFMMAMGVAFGLWFLYVQAKKQGLNASKIIDAAFYTIIISLVGAKLILFIGDISHYLNNPKELFSLARSGGVFQGGLTFGLIFALLYFRKHRIPTWKVADIMGAALALGHGFGRIGCFSAGCCFGRECSLPWGIIFRSQDAQGLTSVPLYKPLHPVQLYESALNFLNFVVLFFILKKKKFNGHVFSFYIINYSIIRYFTEFFRGDHWNHPEPDKFYLIRGSSPYLSLSLPQFFSILGLVGGLILFFVLKKRKNA